MRKSTARNKVSNRTNPPSRTPALESLERRELMAVDIDFSVFTQNTQLRPSSVWENDPDGFARDSIGAALAVLTGPFVADLAEIAVDMTAEEIYKQKVFNTHEDNEERADAVFAKASTYDIVALQEVFDPHQVTQLREAAESGGYRFLLGPEYDTIGETIAGDGFWGKFTDTVSRLFNGGSVARIGMTAGLSTLVRDPVGSVNHEAIEFRVEGSGIDALANKGFTVDLVDMGSGGSVYVINTHMTASDEMAKLEQLQQIADHVETLDARFPVIIVGDLNMPGESATREPDGTYRVDEHRYSRIHEILRDFVDPVHEEFIKSNPVSSVRDRPLVDNYDRQFWTADPTTNAFKYFAHSADPLDQIISYKDRIDHILVRQGSEWGVDVNSLKLEYDSARTEYISDRIAGELAQLDLQISVVQTTIRSGLDDGTFRDLLGNLEARREFVANLRPYLSDHYGLGAQMSLYKYIDFDESTGVLRLKGVQGEVDDRFTAEQWGTDQFSVTHSFGNHTTTVTIPYAPVRSVIGYGRDGNDSFIIDSSQTIATAIYGDAGDDAIMGGAGNDRIFGGSGNDTVYGFGGNDSIDGGAGDDRVFGGDGADVVAGEEGVDVIDGQAGNDRLLGGSGDDTLIGGLSDDQLFGDSGDDTLDGTDGNDILSGGSESDFLYGGNGADTLLGETGDDRLYGNFGDDTLDGGVGDDQLFGGSGDDQLQGGTGQDHLDGEAGSDRLQFAVNLIDPFVFDTIRGGYDLDTLEILGTDAAEQLTIQEVNPGSFVVTRAMAGAQVNRFGFTLPTLMDNRDLEEVRVSGLGGDDVLDTIGVLNVNTLIHDGGDGNDVIRGSDGNDFIVGGRGNDIIEGRGGNDTLYGDDLYSLVSGNDVIVGGSGFDAVYGGAGDDAIDGGHGVDVLYGGPGHDQIDSRADTSSGDSLYGDEGNDQLWGGLGVDTLRGGGGEDYLNGGRNDDLLFGEGDKDTLVGGTGIDFLDGGDGNDFLWSLFEQGSAEQASPSELVNSRLEHLYGGAGHDELHGSDQPDELHGENGNDVIYHSGATDIVFGGDEAGDADQYRVSGTTGNDTLSIQFLNNIATAVVVANSIPMQVMYQGIEVIGLDGDAGNDSIKVSLGQNAAARVELIGGAGNDTIDAAEFQGRAILRGGSGDDVLLGALAYTEAYGDAGTDRFVHRLTRGDLTVTLQPGKLIKKRTGEPEVIAPVVDFEMVELIGTVDGDFIDATAFDRDVTLRGVAGNDRLFGSERGNDVIEGGDGDDILRGNDGNDLLDGGNGVDQLNESRLTQSTGVNLALSDASLTGLGTDSLVRIETADLTGSPLGDRIDASRFTGTTRLFGQDGNDVILGSPASDTIDGGRGNDQIQGNDGNDVLLGGEGDDQLSGGAGHDRLVDNSEIQVGPGAFLDFGMPADVDILIGGDGNDTLLANFGADRLEGGTGNDTLRGGEGNDRLLGNDGNDSLYGDNGNDVLEGGFGSDYLHGVAGADSLYGLTTPPTTPWSAASITQAGADRDRLYGGTGNDYLEGSYGHDYLYGEDGQDRLVGGAGNDYLHGGYDRYSDTLTGSTGRDTFVQTTVTTSTFYKNPMTNSTIGTDVLVDFTWNGDVLERLTVYVDRL